MGSSMSQQLMADIAASLQLAAAANPPPSAPAAAAKLSDHAAAPHMTATPAGLPATQETAHPTQKTAAGNQQDTTYAQHMSPALDLAPDNGGIHSSRDFLACLEEFAAPNPALSDPCEAPAAAAGPDPASTSSAYSALRNEMQVCNALLGQETAAAVLAAAEAAAGSACGPRPGAMPHYTSLAATMPVNVKVGVLAFVHLRLCRQLQEVQCIS